MEIPILFVLAANLLAAQPPAVEGAVKDAFTLRWIDVAEGTGAAAGPGQKYTVHYTGWLRDGKKFDSSRDRSEPFAFTQGKRQVIAGWEAGFEGMKVGGRRRLFIPYQMAYGEKGNATIPPRAELIFDVELLKAEDVPEIPAAVDVLAQLDPLEKKMLALLDALPEEKLGWRPVPGVRSMAEVIVHTANGNRLLLAMAAKGLKDEPLKKVIADDAAREKQAFTKAQLREDLQGSFAEVRAYLKAARAGLLNREQELWGQPNTHRGFFIDIDTHTAEHLGQLIAYARMAGLKIPWSQ